MESSTKEATSKMTLISKLSWWEGTKTFLGATIIVLLLPLFPLGVEYVVRQDIQSENWTIAAAMYAAGIGFASRNVLLFSVAIAITIIMSCAYGLYLGRSQDISIEGVQVYSLAKFCIMIVAVMHIPERFRRHCIERRPLFDVMERGQ